MSNNERVYAVKSNEDPLLPQKLIRTISGRVRQAKLGVMMESSTNQSIILFWP